MVQQLVYVSAKHLQQLASGKYKRASWLLLFSIVFTKKKQKQFYQSGRIFLLILANKILTLKTFLSFFSLSRKFLQVPITGSIKTCFSNSYNADIPFQIHDYACNNDFIIVKHKITFLPRDNYFFSPSKKQSHAIF